MQVMPKLAAANPINVPDVGTADGNIHAGAKMLRNIADTYFNDSGIDLLNKTLFTFASYNAGTLSQKFLQHSCLFQRLSSLRWLLEGKHSATTRFRVYGLCTVCVQTDCAQREILQLWVTVPTSA